MQIEIDIRKQAATERRFDEACVERSGSGDRGGQDNFVDIRACTIGIFTIGYIEAVENIFEIAGLLELLNTKRIKAEREIDACANRPS